MGKDGSSRRLYDSKGFVLTMIFDERLHLIGLRIFDVHCFVTTIRYETRRYLTRHSLIFP
jgi:hypothetical protein